MFYNILERKNAFLGYKNKKFKISKNWGFSKWVSLCFVQKWATSPSFFIFGNIGQEKFFLRYSGSKKRCFLEFVRLYFCRLHCTFRESNKNLFWLDMPKESFEKQNSLFWQKAWTNPFGKFYFFDVFKSFLILSKNYSFLLRISENDLSFLDFEKTRSMD